MTATQFIPKPYSQTVQEGSVTWSSPSNIALVKYWGKKGDQLPENPSISFTLNDCKTITTLEYSKKAADGAFAFEVFLDGLRNTDFEPKIETFFKRVETYLPFLRDYHFKIRTQNTFPHSSGIASSASGMSALALCLTEVEAQLLGGMDPDVFKQKASFLARLGSGSACRSIEGPLVVWGQHEAIEGSSDLYGITYPNTVHAHFKDYQDTILLVDKGQKQVSSTLGHNLMHGHPFAAQRFKQAYDNLSKLMPILASGDLMAFTSLVEQEALSLHAMMLTSTPYFILMKPNTVEIMNRIVAFRAKTGLPVGFTLDAGANVHVLYPASVCEQVVEFIKNELVAYCENAQYICDKIGFGAKQL